LSITPNKQLLTKICKHQYRNPIYLAREWKRDLAEGKYSSQADLSRNLEVSRARVTQILNLLKLPAEIIEKLSALGDPLTKPVVTEHGLRPFLKSTK
jgi:ParB-like chromosome segregation protein Spo0J